MPKKRFIVQKEQEKNNSNGIFSFFRLGESYTNLILGAIVVIAIGIAVVTFLRNNNEGQTSSTSIDSSEEEKSEDATSSTYTIKTGDSLWSISEQIYKSGYNWTQIAKANNLENPGLIHAGNKLNLPEIKKEVAGDSVKSDTETVMKKKPTSNNAITEDKYTVKKGDNLWNISVRAYGDGFRYGEIAKANNLVNPRLIHSGNVLIIPRK